jgi:hypothetical protein
MICKNCGNMVNNTAKYCPICGGTVNRMEAPTPLPVQTYDRSADSEIGTENWMERVWMCGSARSVLAAGVCSIISLFICADDVFRLFYIYNLWYVYVIISVAFSVFNDIFMQRGIPLMMIFVSSKRRKRSTGGYSWIRALCAVKIAIAGLLAVIASGVFVYLTVILSQITKYVNQLKNNVLFNTADELGSLLGYDGLNTRIAMLISEKKTWGYALIGNVLETVDYNIGTCWAILIGKLVLTVCIIVMYILFQAKMMGNMNLAMDVLQGHPLGNNRNISAYSIYIMWFMFIIGLLLCAGLSLGDELNIILVIIGGDSIWAKIVYTLSCFFELMALKGARKKLKA